MKKEKNDVCISTILDDADVFLLLEKNVAVTKMKTFVELGKKIVKLCSLFYCAIKFSLGMLFST